MKTSILKTFAVTGLAFATIFATIPVSDAVPALRIRTAGAVDIVVDDQSGSDASITPGVVLYAGGIGGWLVSVSTGITNPVLGAQNNPVLNLSVTYTAIAGTAGPLEVWFTDQNWQNSPNQPTSYNATAKLVGTSPGADFWAYNGPGNGKFGVGNTLFGPVAMDTVQNGILPFDGNNQYSLTTRIVIQNGPNGSSGSADTTFNLPEGGATIAMMGLSLLGLGMARRRLRNS